MGNGRDLGQLRKKGAARRQFRNRNRSHFAEARRLREAVRQDETRRFLVGAC